MNNTQMGAVDGGIIGGVLGAVVGAVATRNPMGLVYGAAAGAAGGAVVGGLAGNSADRAQQARVQAVDDANQRAYAAACNPPLSLEQIAEMSRRRLSDGIIIEQIRATGSTYYLSTEQIYWLKEQQVSDTVISFMQSRGPQIIQPGAVVAPGYYGPAPVVVGPAYAPVPVAIGVGVGFRR